MNADGSGQTRLTNNPANDYWSDWQALPPASGDTNCSGTVNPVDALTILRQLAALPANACVLLVGDVDCSAALNPLDALAILRDLAGLEVNLPEGCPPIGT